MGLKPPGLTRVLASASRRPDLDYRALSNAGTWIIGRLQTDADRKRVMEGLGEAKKGSPIGELMKKLAPRWFVFRDPKTNELTLLNPRWAMSLLRGPMRRGRSRGRGMGERRGAQ